MIKFQNTCIIDVLSYVI